MGSLEAVVVAIGDELLSGARVNGNAAWLGARLAGVDVRVVQGVVIGDDVEVIAATIEAAAARADLVIVTGGLGPTLDDRTRGALAAVLGGGLARDAFSAARITDWYTERGRVPSEAVLEQANVPVGASALLNPVGTAPGLRAFVDGAEVVCLPGVPSEMAAIMESAVLPRYAARPGGGIAVATLRVALVPETLVADTIAAVEARAAAAGVQVAYLPSVAELVVRFVAGADAVVDPHAGTRQGLVDGFAAESARLLGDVVVTVGPETLAQVVVAAAAAAGVTVALAESLTGGLVAADLTTVPGASQVVRGGVVAYSSEVKASALGVDPALLARVGAVHGDVAAQMALGVRDRLGAVYGVATTGVAGPESQDGAAVGTVHVAVAGPGGVRLLALDLHGDRARIRAASVVHALEALRRAIRGLPEPRGRDSERS
jgi:nicotinamide-nucleotide amidase